MSGIYIHIPFCKQACSYCDFHFTTAVKNRPAMVDALVRELGMRAGENRETVDTIYFGGGTPSVLEAPEIRKIIDAVYANCHVGTNPEITLEANPDDLSPSKLGVLKDVGINRLSVGVQSFYDDDLRLMNRAHNAREAVRSLEMAAGLFDNISADLIYGTPGLTDEKWEANIDRLLMLGIPHISSYALTVERKTALEHQVKAGNVPAPDDAQAARQFDILVRKLTGAGFVHYELSNFGKPGYFSRNNSAYWLGKNYIGIGPSAHSYNGVSRSWNISNNLLYIKSLDEGKLPSETEILTETDRYNEMIMTGLRTIWGVDVAAVESRFGTIKKDYLMQAAARFLESGFLELAEGVIRTTAKGKFLADGIAGDLFWVR